MGQMELTCSTTREFIFRAISDLTATHNARRWGAVTSNVAQLAATRRLASQVQLGRSLGVSQARVSQNFKLIAANGLALDELDSNGRLAYSGPDLLVPWRTPTLTVLYTNQDLDLEPLGFAKAMARGEASLITRYVSDRSLREVWPEPNRRDLPLRERGGRRWKPLCCPGMSPHLGEHR
jgi:biotin operon repressor